MSFEHKCTITDLSVTSLVKTDATWIVAGDTTSITLDTVITNLANASGDYVPATEAPDVNYILSVQLSSENLTVPDGNLPSFQLSLSSTSLVSARQSLLAGGSITLSGTVNVDVAEAQCEELGFICVFLSEGPSAQFHDVDSNNNAACIDITQHLACHPGITL